MKEKMLNLFVLVILVSTIVLSPLAARPIQAAQAGVLIEPQLQAQLNADAATGYLIYFRDKADLSAASQLNWHDRGWFVLQTLQATAQRSQSRVQSYLDRQGASYRSFWIDNVIAVEQSDRVTVQGLLAFPEIESLRAGRTMSLIEPDKVEGAAQPTGVEPNIAHVNADDVWTLGLTGQGAVVGSIDTGVRYTHQALVNQYRGNLGSGLFDHNYNWYDPYGNYPDTPTDDNGHGTHTMGTMAGDDGGANQIGMAPGAQWMACRGCGEAGCTDTALFTCAQFMAAPTDLRGGNPNPDLRPYVVNNSWGDCGRSYDGWFQGAVDNWQAAGIYPVFANGNALNCGYSMPPLCGTVSNPARYGNVTGVGSTGQQDGAYAAHSLRGPSDRPDTVNPNGYPSIKPTVMAPGVDIRSAINTGDSDYEGGWSGTSMSAPHVTGLIALLWSAAPCLVGDYAATEDILEATATPITTGLPGACQGEGWGHYPNQSTGWGEINALAAVQQVVGSCGDSTLAGHVSAAPGGDPLPNATITADPGAAVHHAHSDSQGNYDLSLSAGAYTVTISSYGYIPEIVPGVTLTTGLTTTLDASLAPAESYDLYGVVADEITGWPLYAQIDIGGYPGGFIWTDPATGAYSITLAGNTTYTLRVAAWTPGYLPSGLAVGPLTADEQHNLVLAADPAACSAPGYELTALYRQNFETSSGGYTAGGVNSSWAWGMPTSGPGSAHSGANVWATGLAVPYNNDEDSTLTSPDLDMSAFTSTLQLTWWQWLQVEDYRDSASVEVSTNGGASWATVYGPVSGNVDLGWAQHRVLLDPSYAVPNLRLRFHLASGYEVSYPGWYIDDVTLATPDSCHALPGGLIVGNVYDANTAGPLNGAAVTTDGGVHAVTVPTPDDPAADDGLYVLFAETALTTVHALTVTLTPYAPGAAIVIVPNGGAVRQDFSLAAGRLSLAPAVLSATIELGTAVDVPVLFTNLGNEAAGFRLTEVNKGAIPGHLSIPASDGHFTHSPASLGPAPRVDRPRGPATVNPLLLPGARAYAVDLLAGQLGFFNSDAPGGWTIVGDVPGAYYYAGDFLGGDFSRLYVVDYIYQLLYTLDTRTGAATLIGPVPPLKGENWTGLTGSPDGVLYAVSTQLGNSTLYTVDPATGTPAVIGSITNGPGIIDIAMNAAGELYGVDIMNDTLVRIDPRTAAGTVVGSIGFDANHAQGMDFEEESGVLYLAAFNGGTSQGELRVADLATGNTDLVGTLPYGSEMDCLAFASGGASDVPWLREEPTTGTIPALATMPVTITLDGTVLDGPGTYYATVNAIDDTPYGTSRIPVTLTVTPPPTYGKLWGVVTGLGYCDQNPGVLANAVVTVTSRLGRVWTLETDELGYYQQWLTATASPLTVTAAYPGHEPQTAIEVIVPAQGQAEASLGLRQLVPCLGYEPESIEAWVLTGTAVYTASSPLTLTNRGAGPLTFALREIPGEYAPPVRLSLPAGDGHLTHSPASIGPAPVAGKAVTPSGGDPLALLGAQAYAVNLLNGTLGFFDTTTPANWTTVGSVGKAQYFAGDFLDGDFSHLYVIDSNDNYLYTLDTTTAVATPVGPVTPAAGQGWTGLAGSPDGTLYAVSTGCKAGSTLYTIDPATGIETIVGTTPDAPCLIDIAVNAAGEMYGVDIINDVLMRIDPATGAGTTVGSLGFDANWAQGMDFEEISGVLYLAAFNDETLQGELRVADLQTGNTALVGAFPGGAEVDCLALATGGIAPDVPWLWEDPVTGTVPAQGLGVVDVAFTALYTDGTPMPLGVYTATIKIGTDDPMAGRVQVPVVMHIVSAGEAPAAGFVADTPVCVNEPLVLTNTTVPGFPPETSYSWDWGDGTVSFLEHPVHVYTESGSFTVTLTACNGYGECDEAAAPVEVAPLPTAAFTFTANLLVVTLTNQSLWADEYSWSFGDGITSTEADPVHIYAAEGTYTVTLWASGACGVTLATMPIAVQATPARYRVYLPFVILTTSHTLTATRIPYTSASATLVVPTNGAAGQGFSLPAGMFSFTPSPLSATVELNTAAEVPAVLANQGGSAATFTLTEVNWGGDPLRVSIPAGDGRFFHSPPSLGRAPRADGPAGSTLPSTSPLALLGAPAYAVDLIGSNMVTFDSDTPDSWTVVGSVGWTSYYAGDFLGGDFSRLYVIDYNTNVLYTLDTTTAAATPIGPVNLPGEGAWTGLAGAPDGTLYAASTDCANSTLYTIDPATGTPTAVGPITNAPCLIDLAVNATGQLYGVDIADDVLLQIDPATAAGTVIGSIGFDANYSQGMDFEESSGVLYLAAYNANTLRGELRVASLVTGNTALIGAFPDGVEADCLAFATGGTADAPWLSESPTSGLVPPFAGRPITVTLDAGQVAQPGTYYADINIDSDTPYDRIQVPVTLTVTPPDSYGKLWGTVTDLGYCDDNPGVLADAVVTIESYRGGAWTIGTDRLGYYQLWLDEAASPLTVTVSFPEHETGLATGVTIVGQGTTEASFDLRRLKPCLKAESPAFETELVWGDQATWSLTLTNAGAVPLNYHFFEVYPDYQPSDRAAGYGEWLDQATTGAPGPNNRGEGSPGDFMAYRWTPERPAADIAILLYADDGFHLPPNTYPDQALRALGLPYTAYYNSNMAGFQRALNGDRWDMVLFANEQYNPDETLLADLNGYILAGGKLVFSTTRIGNLPNLPLWASLGFTHVATVQQPMPIYWWEPSHPLFNTPADVPAFTALAGGYGLWNGHQVEPLPGFTALAGYTTPGPDHDKAALILGHKGRTLFRGFVDGTNDADLDGDGVPDGVELWINIAVGLQTGFSSGVPWLAEEPITGTIAPDGGQAMIEISIDSAQATQPGLYHVGLTVKNDDPLAAPMWPVTMTVLPAADMGKLRGRVADSCSDGPIQASVDFIGGVPIGQVATDDAGWYDAWLISGTYPVVFSSAGYEPYTGTATVVAGQSVTLSATLIPLQPCLVDKPKLVEAWLLTGTESYTASSPLTLVNEGGAPLTFQLFETEGRYSPPAGLAAPPATAEPVTLLGARAYAVDLLTKTLVFFDTETPENWTTVGSTGRVFYPAGDFLNGDFSHLYVINGDDNSLYTLDTTTAVATMIGPVTPAAGHGWTGLAGSLEGTLYAASTDYTSNSTLYTVDPATGATRVVGPVTNAPYLADIAVNAAGEMYGVEVTNDVLVRIDPATGAGTVVGPLGFDANYIQGTDFDETTGVLYLTAFNGATFQSELRVADLQTGNTTRVGVFPGENEVNCLALATGGIAPDVPWLREDPVTGTVPAQGLSTVELAFTARYTDGTPMPLGTYTATLKIKTNDPRAGRVQVPVAMHIVASGEAPAAGFVAATPVWVDEPLVLTNTTVPGFPPETSYTWDWGDGNVSFLEQPVHVYTETGSFTVTLTACNGWGECDEAAAPVEVLSQRFYIYLPLAVKGYAPAR